MSRRAKKSKRSTGATGYDPKPSPSIAQPRTRRWLLIGAIAALIVGGRYGLHWSTRSHDASPVTLPDLTEVGPELRTLLAETIDYLRDHTNEADAYGKLGRALHAEMVFDAARQCYDNARRLDPDNYTWWYYLGKLEAKRGRQAEAIANYRRTTALEPEYPFAHLYLGELLIEADAVSEAETAIRAFVRLEPGEPAGPVAFGRIARARGDLVSAQQAFAQAVTLDPRYGPAHYHLGLVLRDLGHGESAKTHLTRSQRLEQPLPPYDPLMVQVTDAGVSYRSLINRTKQAQREGNGELAAELCRRLLSRWPDEPFVHYLYGTLRLRAGDAPTAEKHLRQAIELRPDHADAMVLLAGILLRAGRTDEGLGWQDRAVAARPDDAGIYHNQATNLLTIGRHDDAVASLRQAVRLDADNPVRHQRLGEVLLRLGRHAEAEQALADAVRLDSQLGEAQFLLACAYCELRRMDEAIAALTVSVRLNYATSSRCRSTAALAGLRSDPRYLALFSDSPPTALIPNN